MVEITDKHDCCGCASCVQACPRQCITFEADAQGFRYPAADLDRCVDCGLCEKVCPVLNQAEARKPLKVFAAINPDEDVRLKSSSGGVFTLLAEAIIAEGGVVFGARFDENWDVVHDYTETVEGLAAFRGSKYVQSRIGDTYRQARGFLKAGRKVLYTGTSCQIAGLMKYLRKAYDNLVAVDVVCHGAPSPGLWKAYLSDRFDCGAISGISFRNKSAGWKNFCFVVRSVDGHTLCEPFGQNLFMKFFLNNLSLRPSCYRCPAKSGRSCADITLADFWGYDQKYSRWNDDKGVSLVLGYSPKGCSLLERLPDIAEADYGYALRYNPPIEHSVPETEHAGEFWSLYAEGGIKAARKVNRRFEAGFGHRLAGWLKRNLLKRSAK